MTEENDSRTDDVAMNVELSGAYEDVLDRLRHGDETPAPLAAFVDDVERVLDTIDRMGEGTRSAIADQLPDDTTVDYDAETLVTLLQTLKHYDLVTLDGNTWKLDQDIRK